MGVEIERKFLVEMRDWDSMGEGTVLRQGYFPTEGKTVIRVRVGGGEAFLTVKGPDRGRGRLEFEYPVPPVDAEEMLIQFCRKPIIEKTRYRIPHAGLTWEVDVFHSDNQGLVVAEVELSSPGQEIDLPPWVDREVTGDPKYSNASLVQRPFHTWETEEFP
jgi:CYTH domain-containing protein